MPSGRLTSCLEAAMAKKQPKPKTVKHDWIAEKLRPLAVPVEDLHVDPHNTLRRVKAGDHNPDLRFGRTIYLVAISIRGPHGFYGGPAGYRQMPKADALKRLHIIDDARTRPETCSP